MSVQAAAGYPQQSGTFIPEIWSGKLLVKFYDATVLAAISNTDYEGEIKKFGDKVNIRTTPDITIHDYEKGQNLETQTPEAPIVELPIDYGKYFNFIEDDVDKIQSDINKLEDWAQDASEQMKIAVDTEQLGLIYADAHANNAGNTAGRISGSYNLGSIGTPRAVTKADILDFLVDCGSVLDENNVPENERYIVLPATICGLLKKSDLKNAMIMGDGVSVLRNGRLGMIDRFTIYSSNLLTTATVGGNLCYHVIFGQRHGISFASQLTDMEKLRSEFTFGWKVRGLNVYGCKVLKSQALGHAVIYKG